jgi:hypothetical protein
LSRKRKANSGAVGTHRSLSDVAATEPSELNIDRVDFDAVDRPSATFGIARMKTEPKLDFLPKVYRRPDFPHESYDLGAARLSAAASTCLERSNKW